ncbi:MAG: hypothetical protein IT161_18285 [Bryobacterales bacterium]|nr:hypothetical protein [Bryobacterales bacterium]
MSYQRISSTLLGALLIQAICLGVDLSKAVIVTPAKISPVEEKAITVLIEEVEKRTQIRLPRAERRDGPAIVIARAAPGRPAEGYTIATDAASVTVTGNDSRGVLYGVGGLLRQMRMKRGGIEIPDGFEVTTAPKYALRGHQLGYRPKTNSYDGWTVGMWEQYIRDLAIFGANAIELIPPRSDDAPDSPHFPLPQMPMMIEMARIIDEYGMDVWVWYPALDQDYSDPKKVEFALNEWGEVFKKLKRVDAVFVPGGDPGHTQPKYLMALLEKQTANLRKYHPKAQMWVSPQGFSREWLDEFNAILKTEPAWLTGLVHGPQVRGSIEEFRRAVPKRYPIRTYPDITHSTHAQYVVPDWDLAYALTYYREPINPRPLDQAAILRDTLPLTIGFLTYSEGCNDDVNKTVWSYLGWDPSRDVAEGLREFGRYFIGADMDDAFAQGLLALEQNWRGALASNGGVSTTLAQFQAMERAATPELKRNWRFQQALYRAYYDAYVRRRLLHEMAAEQEAYDALRSAGGSGSERALELAQTRLALSAETVAPDLRIRVYELAEALFQSVRMQLSVAKYGAISRDRGATLDGVEAPLNDSPWLARQIAAIRKLAGEDARLRQIERLVNWTDPGPGGFYDDLGNPAMQPHLVRGPAYAADPGFLRGPFTGFARMPWRQQAAGWRTSWLTDSESFYDTPVQLRYSGLDRSAQYRVRVIYGGEPSPSRVLKVTANNGRVLQPERRIEALTDPVEFDVPREETAGGELTLSWSKPRGMGGNGRGCQIAEVWLIRR